MGIVQRLTSNGTLYTAGTLDEATFNPSSGYKKNLFQYSTTISNLYYISYNSFLIPNAGLAPDVTSTASLLVGNTGQSGRKAVYQYISNISYGLTYTYSVYLKSAGFKNVNIWFDVLNTTPYGYQGAGALIDLTNGTVGGNGQASVIPIGDGWYRCYVTATVLQSGGVNFQISLGDANGSGTAVGDGVSGVYVWGFQVELGTVPTVYEPTGPNAVPIPTAKSKLDANGNIYLTGTYDEVTFNRNSGYTKNILPYSQDFTRWGYPSNFYVVPNAIAAPDGTLTASKFTIPDTTPSNIVQYGVTVPRPSTKYYTFSVYVKQLDVNNPYVCFYFGTDYPLGNQFANNFGNEITFNFNTLTFGGASFPAISTSYVTLQDGWYRLSMTVQPVINGTTTPINISYIRVFMYSNQGYGRAAGTAYFWGTQIEEGTVATTYVATGANAVPISNTASRMESSGNHFVSQLYDEVSGIPPVTDSLVLYVDAAVQKSWSGSGTIWYDISGANNHLTLTGTPTPTVNPLGYFNFNASQANQNLYQFVYGLNNPVPESIKFNGRAPYTLMVWVKITKVVPQFSYQRILDRDSPDSVTGVRSGYNLWIDGSADGLTQNISAERYCYPAGVGNGSVSISLPTSSFINSWNHFTITFDGSTMRMYRNGILATTGSTSGNIVNNSEYYTIFKYGSNKGYVGQNLVYSRALTATEVLDTYNATKLRYVN
jgi:hypothetical protein